MSQLSVLNILFKFIFIMIVYALLLFIPAGTYFWPEAWVCLIIACAGFGFQIFWFRDAPNMQSRASIQIPTEKWDRILYIFLLLGIFGTLIIAGLDYRFNKPEIPLLLKIVGDLILCLSFIIFFLVLRENVYLSKIVVVTEDQQVSSTGLYSFVRHPHYLAVSLLMISLPFGLGTLLALIPATASVILLMIRIKLEEELLKQELNGYSEYVEKVRYRLVPKIW